jgi:hypothetical protein
MCTLAQRGTCTQKMALRSIRPKGVMTSLLSLLASNCRKICVQFSTGFWQKKTLSVWASCGIFIEFSAHSLERREIQKTQPDHTVCWIGNSNESAHRNIGTDNISLYRHVYILFSLSQDIDPNSYSLVEVLLDKGVTEHVLTWNDSPWAIINNVRKVCINRFYFLWKEQGAAFSLPLKNKFWGIFILFWYFPGHSICFGLWGYLGNVGGAVAYTRRQKTSSRPQRVVHNTQFSS